MRGRGIPRNETRSQLVDNLNVVATIVDLAQAKPDVALDGQSLVPCFTNPDAVAREALLLESTVNRFQNPAKRYSSVRTPRLKYIRYNGGFDELFDLKVDPSELNNEAQNPVYASELEKLVKRSSEPLSLFRLRLENFIFVRLLIYKRTRECLTD